jgi:hypothetical protein
MVFSSSGIDVRAGARDGADDAAPGRALDFPRRLTRARLAAHQDVAPVICADGAAELVVAAVATV